MNSFWFAFGLTVLAGLATGIGSAIAFFTKKTDNRYLSVALGFSAGVMIYISLNQLLPSAKETLETALGENRGAWAAIASFFGGMLLTGLIDMIVPNVENPHEFHKEQKDLNALQQAGKNPKALMRIGLLTAAVLALHNFPEGFATFISALGDPTMAVPVAFAVALHNITEGIAVSIPIYYATGERKKAFLYSFASGLTEPLGALAGYFLLKPFLGDTLLGVVFAGVAGIMVYISFDELLPAAREYGKHHLCVSGLFCGMALMAVSLTLF